MNKLKTHSEVKVPSAKVGPLVAASERASMASKTNSDKDKDKDDRAVSRVLLEIYSTNSRKCLVVKKVEKEARQMLQLKDKMLYWI